MIILRCVMNSLLLKITAPLYKTSVNYFVNINQVIVPFYKENETVPIKDYQWNCKKQGMINVCIFNAIKQEEKRRLGLQSNLKSHGENSRDVNVHHQLGACTLIQERLYRIYYRHMPYWDLMKTVNKMACCVKRQLFYRQHPYIRVHHCSFVIQMRLSMITHVFFCLWESAFCIPMQRLSRL